MCFIAIMYFPNIDRHFNIIQFSHKPFNCISNFEWNTATFHLPNFI